MYAYRDKTGRIVIMAGAHVDDIMWAADPKYEYLITNLFEHFQLNQIEEGNFRFCGREYEQYEKINIRITCKDNTEKIPPINFKSAGRRLNDKATEGEIAQMRSVVGSLAWISRQVRPEMCYHTSKMQSVRYCTTITAQ